MGYKITTPAADVLTAGDLRTQLRLTAESGSHPHDALIQSLQRAAMEFAQAYRNRAVGAQTVELALDAFPCGAMALPLGAASVTSLKYLDASQIEVTLPSTDYLLDTHSFESWLLPTTTWPAAGAVATGANVIKVVYVTPAEVPDAVKNAIRLLVQFWYDNPTATDPEAVPVAVKTLLNIDRVWHI